MSGFDRINGVASDPDEYVGSGGAKGEISSVLHVNTTLAGTAADTNETDLWSYTLPANTLSANGKALRITASGSCAANGNTKTVRFYFGASSITVNNATAAPNGVDWFAEVLVIRTGAGAQRATGTRFVSTVTQSAFSTLAPTENETANIVIKVTGQNGTAAADDILFRCAVVEALN